MLTDPRPDDPDKSSRRVLDPMYRVNEVLFGLIMVLTFTGSISAAEEGRAGIRAMLVGALGCNLAWGIIDGVMYLMACLGERGRELASLRAVRQAVDAAEAHRAIAGALPEALANMLQPEEFETIRRCVHRLPDPAAHPRLRKGDWHGALAVFLWVFVSTFPVVIPFIILRNAALALRMSNGVAVMMLFLTGFAFGRSAGYHPWTLGFSMILLGSALVGITIALGG